MIFDSNPDKTSMLQAINEVYFDKTPEILAMEKQLHKFRSKYMGRYISNISVNSDEDLLKFNRMVEDYFGFGCFTLHIQNEIMPNAFTLPLDYRIDVGLTSNSIEKGVNHFKLNKKLDYTGIVYITSAVMFNSDFTTPEVMAVILHEIGHNFYFAFSEKNCVMVTTCKILYTAITLMNNPIELLKYSETSIKMVKKFEKEIRTNSAFSGVLDLIQVFRDTGRNIIYFIADVFDMMTLGLANPLFAILGGLMNLSNQSILRVIFFWNSYSSERSADNFATIHGYGADLNTALNKIETATGNKLKEIYLKTPFVSHLYMLNMDLTRLLISPFDEHPVTISRATDQLNLLKNEANKTDIDPKLRKVLLSDIAECERSLKVLTDTKISNENKHILRNAYFKALYNVTGGKEFKDLIDDPNKFKDYDNTYNYIKGGKK